MNAANRTQLGPEWAPDRNDGCRFYQALIGVWPAELPPLAETVLPDVLVERLQAYMLKAAKEAKVHTSWIQDNEQYDAALVSFVERTLRGPSAIRFLESFAPFAHLVARAGMINSLAQVLLKIASPGVPDFYQGSELWDLNLVDPDNRRPVDYARRATWLEELRPLLERRCTCDDASRPRGVCPPGGRPHGDCHRAPTDRQARIARWFAGRTKRLANITRARATRAGRRTVSDYHHG
jgi:(1->4)-alpha-D-glucan 1-alpha-D-glucosylmutase